MPKTFENEAKAFSEVINRLLFVFEDGELLLHGSFLRRYFHVSLNVGVVDVNLLQQRYN